jgi:hypothetical protein
MVLSYKDSVLQLSGGGCSGSAAVVCSSAISGPVTWYTAELTSDAKCLAYFYPLIGLRWAQKRDNTADHWLLSTERFAHDN